MRKNLFRSSYHVAILYGGNDHVIELNEFHHVVTITYDSGAIYAGRDLTSRGTVRASPLMPASLVEDGILDALPTV